MACREPIRVRIEFTPEQRKQIQIVTGESIDAIELTVEELEQRAAPATPPAFT